MVSVSGRPPNRSRNGDVVLVLLVLTEGSVLGGVDGPRSKRGRWSLRALRRLRRTRSFGPGTRRDGLCSKYSRPLVVDQVS